MINNSWCDRKNAHPIQYLCSPDLQYLTLLYRRFGYRGNSQRSSLQLFTSPLKPTQMQHSRNCMGIYAKQKTVHHDAAFIITRDFNKADLRRIAPKLFQHISCNTRGEQTLDHRYCGHRNAYKSLPCPPLGKSDSLLTGRT